MVGTRLVSAQDPAELFDIYDADGTPAGYSKPRAAVHHDGDWHRAVHVWVIGQTAVRDSYLLVQRRGYAKDTWPGYLDVTVGGHYGAGETVIEVLRETDEEIGVRCELTHLIPLGTRVSASERPDEGISDHEFQDVFLYRDDRPLTGFVPNPAELAELLQIALDDLVALLKGQRASVPAISLDVDEGMVRETTIRAEEFVPTTDRYYLNVAILAQRALRGDDNLALSLGA